jgi:hypothetical protein
VDRIPELVGESERLRAILWVRLCCRRRVRRDDEVLEQHAERLGLDRVRVNDKEVIAEEALLLINDQVGLQHLLPAPRARHDEGYGD